MYFLVVCLHSLACNQDVSELIREAVDVEILRVRAALAASITSAAPTAGKEPVKMPDLALSSDDLVPIWVYTIVHATAIGHAPPIGDPAAGSGSGPAVVNPFRIHAYLDYMSLFHVPPPTAPQMTSELFFHLANVQAALSVH